MIEFNQLRALWKVHRDLRRPPAAPIRLWADRGCGIWISEKWGPAVPYLPVDHGNGNMNHGYIRAKGDADAASRIPEAGNWPELQSFLQAANADSSPIETVGCEKSFFSDETADSPPVYLGSYFDLVFTEGALNDQPENLLFLAGQLANSVENCERWWASVSFVLQKLRGLPESNIPWGLMLHVTNHGRDEQQARKLWGETLLRLGKTISGLPRDFRAPT